MYSYSGDDNDDIDDDDDCAGVVLLATVAGQSLTTAIHRTQAAQERINDLKCYKCDTMDDGELCVDVVNSNATNFVHKCEGDEFICMVRIGFSFSGELG